MLAVRAATRGHHHHVMQKAENSIGVNNRIAELRAPIGADDVVACSVAALYHGPRHRAQVD